MDLLVEERLVSAVGPIVVSVVGHGDDSLSVVARLLMTGRNVGLARWQHGPVTAASWLLDEALIGSSVERSMRRLLQRTIDQCLALRRIGTIVPAPPMMTPLLVSAR
jgi:hypothetical protein